MIKNSTQRRLNTSVNQVKKTEIHSEFLLFIENLLSKNFNSYCNTNTRVNLNKSKIVLLADGHGRYCAQTYIIILIMINIKYGVYLSQMRNNVLCEVNINN